METVDIALIFLFPFGALWGFALCNLLDSRRQRKCPMVAKSQFDEMHTLQKTCVDGWNHQIDVTKGLTDSLEKANQSNREILETLDRANRTNEELLKLASGGGLDNGK